MRQEEWGRDLPACARLGRGASLQETDCKNADYDNLLAEGQFKREDHRDGEDEDDDVGCDC